MPTDHREKLAKIRRFDQLIAYLRDEMGWPINQDSFEDVDDLFYEFSPEELGIDPKIAAKIDSIRRLRPLSARQPWGIFFVKFEPKRLPVVALRRILSQVVLKKRPTARYAQQVAWAAGDLLFVSNYGEGEERRISFAHFSHAEDRDDLPTLKVLGWDNLDTPLHLDAVARQLTQNLAWPQDENDVEAWRKNWRSAFTLRHREVITTSHELSIQLADLARAIRDRIDTVLMIETERGPLTKLMKAFQDVLVHDLDAESFADMYAQTIAYGLLSARITDPNKRTVDDFASHMRTNPFLREMMETFLRVGGRRGKAGGPGIDFDELGVSEVMDLLDDANMEAIVRDFGDRNPQEDPVIHFYESFLQEYDAEMRMQRGVFYTPRPVVSYIVRSVDEVLRTEFGLEDGLADTTTWGEMTKRHKGLEIPEGVSGETPFIQVLDPATGTATFLVEVIDVIYRTMMSKWQGQGMNDGQRLESWNRYVPQSLLPRLHGFELMMAPYAMAHMKVGLKLVETGYRFDSDERARIYLTNTLEAPKDFSGQFAIMVPSIAEEASAANEVKRHVVMTVVVGNPPYSIMSANLTDEARQTVERYRYVDGKRIRERSAIVLERTLQDDYVKFFSCGEQSILRSSTGILGMITNNGFLEAIGLRGLRGSLLDTFDTLHFLDLHGATDKRHVCEDGTLDKNVFDIATGVAISVLTRLPCSTNAKGEAFRCDLYGERNGKYGKLTANTIGSLGWNHLNPRPDSYDFRVYDETVRSEWDSFVSLSDLMPFSATGIETGKDGILTDFTRSDLVARMRRFGDPHVPDSQIRKEFDAESGCARRMADARHTILSDPLFSRRAIQFLFTPFDVRYVFYRKDLLNVHSYQAACQLIEGPNICLIAMRQVAFGGDYTHAFVSRLVPNNRAFYSTRGKVYFFPLVVKASPGEMLQRVVMEPIVNIDGGILQDGPLSQSEPHDILHYVYATLWSRAYVKRYDTFLRAGYPRLPLQPSIKLFDALRRAGADLVAVHLLEGEYPHASWNTPNRTRGNPLETTVTRLAGSGETMVFAGYPRYDAGKVHLTSSRWFESVPEPVWMFTVGGYQVCEKWLKDRKGRMLSTDDIREYQKIIAAVSETIRIMGEIDEAIEEHGGWPGAFVCASVSSSATPGIREARRIERGRLPLPSSWLDSNGHPSRAGFRFRGHTLVITMEQDCAEWHEIRYGGGSAIVMLPGKWFGQADQVTVALAGKNLEVTRVDC